MTKELKEQIHERVYNLKVPTLGFSRRELFDIAIEYAEPREKQLQEKDKKIKELEAQIEKVKHYLDYDIPHNLINEATTKIWRMLK